MLTLAFLVVATSSHDEHDEHENKDHNDLDDDLDAEHKKKNIIAENAA